MENERNIGIGVNTFGFQEAMWKDFEGTLEALRNQGYTHLEGCIQLEVPGAVPKERSAKHSKWDAAVWTLSEASEKVECVRKAGFIIDGCHLVPPAALTPDMLERLIQEIVGLAKRLSLRYCVMSLMLKTEAMRKYVGVINTLVDTCQQEGICFLYHNHDMECETENGVSALDLLLEECPKLQFQPDLGWLMIGGVDPVDFINRHADRIKILHFKDFSRISRSDECMNYICAVGEGILPLGEIADAVKSCKLGWGSLIVDQDNSLTNIFQDTAKGIQNLQAMCL